jgi:histidine triad (HIT) family protein
MAGDCFFCRIVAGKEKSWKVFEDEKHLAFLTPFPNTPGFTVVIPKQHLSSDVLSLDEREYIELLLAAKKFAKILNERLGCERSGLIIEGMGIDHAHVKLIPMHGIEQGEWKAMLSDETSFSETYQGVLTTHDGPRMSDEELDMIQRKILG